jgi:xylose isomerase
LLIAPYYQKYILFFPTFSKKALFHTAFSSPVNQKKGDFWDMNQKYASGLWVFAQSIEKFGGYTQSLSVDEKIKAAGSVPGLKGVELIAPTHVTLETVVQVQNWLSDVGLDVVSINPYLWTEPVWKRGALTSPDPNVRRESIETGKRAVDIAREMGAKKMCLWPGEDGWDYYFQADYEKLWNYTSEGIAAIAEYGSDIQIGIEYKLKEPRTHMLLSNAAKAAWLGCALNLPNVGAYLDFGHALMSKENPAESVAFLSQAKRLVGIHVNDNYGAGDDDVVVGSVHFWAMLEFLFTLDRVGYDDWITLDIVPTRENIVDACTQSLITLTNFQHLLEAIDHEELKAIQSEMDAMQAQRIIQNLLVKP